MCVLSFVICPAGLQPGDPSVQHIHLIGLDTDMTGTPYAASIPIDKALSEAGDVLLAWEMNGQPIPRDHGGPLRVIVPGTTGARSVKWIGECAVAGEVRASV
jgi:sulfite oxidase